MQRVQEEVDDPKPENVFETVKKFKWRLNGIFLFFSWQKQDNTAQPMLVLVYEYLTQKPALRLRLTYTSSIWLIAYSLTPAYSVTPSHPCLWLQHATIIREALDYKIQIIYMHVLIIFRSTCSFVTLNKWEVCYGFHPKGYVLWRHLRRHSKPYLPALQWGHIWPGYAL